MHACRRRAINWDQHDLIWFALTGGYSNIPEGNFIVGNLEQLRRMGFLRLDDKIPGFRKYKVNEECAAAIGMSLPAQC